MIQSAMVEGRRRVSPVVGMVRLLAAGVLGASLSYASVILSVYDHAALPPFDPLVSSIGLGVAGTKVLLFTTSLYYSSPLYNGGLSFTQVADLSGLIPLNLESVALVDPLDPNWFYLSAQLGPNFRIYGFRQSPQALRL